MIVVDARAMRCPWPAIRLARALRGAQGQAVPLIADDPAAEREVTALATAQGRTLSIARKGDVQEFHLAATP